MTTDYVSEQEFLDYIKSSSDTGDANTQAAISSASRAVEAFTGRVFYQREETTLYYSSYDLSNPLVEIDDLATTTDLQVSTDTGGDGTYSTDLTINVDFMLEPRNQTFGGIPGFPYTHLRARGLLKFPIRYYPWYPDTISVTGTFGWTEVPEVVKQATKIMAAQYYKLAEAPFGVAGFGSYGEIRVRDIPQAATLLAPYRRGLTFGIA